MGKRTVTTLPDATWLNDLFKYDSATGSIVWRKSAGRAKAGDAAFNNPLPAGYLKGTVEGRGYYAHRIAWKMTTGNDPQGDIDHINGDRGDNRFENLRDCTHAENRRNSKLPSNNKHGVTGLTVRKGRWGATIGSGNKRVWLGTFATKEEATAARKGAEAANGYHRNHGRTKT